MVQPFTAVKSPCKNNGADSPVCKYADPDSHRSKSKASDKKYAQTIAPPAASVENAWITNTLIESTSDTAEIAADPTLLTIIVSAVPMMEFKWKKDLPLVRFYTHYSRPTSSCKALIKKSDKYHMSEWGTCRLLLLTIIY